MFNQVFETWYRAVEATVEAQQELFQRWVGVRPAAAARQPPLHDPPTKPDPVRISGVPGFNRAELEELREALVEYEIAEGDWSKSR